MKDIIVKKMTDKLILLDKKKSIAESKAEGSLFLGTYRAKKREEARYAFWKAVREEFKELSDLDASCRYDNTIVFKPYRAE